VTYFEPGVLAPPDTESAERDLKLFATFSDSDGGLLENAVQFTPGTNVERRSC